ncbi:hypothetical protein [Haloarcula salinisoli]|uniref:Uncharacterized protein n=1 Tax=Haloarcula salinisoli TaxID=2487746 RepID=A0A8J8C9X0_9EURY|nr:hypothetical protein [Halomicroarcula salinisoli]MBX0286114.1 hypothetical protein [Halomicroarcula salinisoli]MBX0302398.1 hypothetical protein [Halomicroarcula salinisoli]
MVRKVTLLATVLVAVLLVVGTSGFTAATVTRPGDIDVADDDRAYLSYETGCDGDALETTLTNRYTETELRVTVTANGTERTTALDSLTEATLRFDAVSRGDSVAVSAANPDGGIAIQFTRSVTASCP